MPDLEELARLIESATANGKLSLDDVRVLPLLRSAAVVKGLRFAKGARILRNDDGTRSVISHCRPHKLVLCHGRAKMSTTEIKVAVREKYAQAALKAALPGPLVLREDCGMRRCRPHELRPL
jgi:hypothetical protein